MGMKHSLMVVMLAFANLVFVPRAVFSQTPFYQGKTVKIVNNDPTGTGGLRVKVLLPYLRKHIPGNPTVVMEWVEGAGG